MNIVKEWTSLTMPELFTIASLERLEGDLFSHIILCLPCLPPFTMCFVLHRHVEFCTGRIRESGQVDALECEREEYACHMLKLTFFGDILQ